MENRSHFDKLIIAANQRINERDYWLNVLSGDLVKIFFPIDLGETESVSYEKGVETFCFTDKIFSRLSWLSNGSDHTLHIYLIAAIMALLAKYTSNSDLIIGTPIYKQNTDADFINTVLPIRNSLDPQMTFKEFVIQVSQRVIDSVKNQNYPIEVLLDQLNMPLSGNPGDSFPLFDVTVSLENIHDRTYLRHIHNNISFSFLRTGESIEGVLEYNALLYEKNTVLGIIDHLATLMREVFFNMENPISRANILSPHEKEQLLFQFNDTKKEFTRDKLIHQLFEEKAERDPECVVLQFENQQFTYRELNKKSNQLASYLHTNGVNRDTIIAMMLESSVEMILGILGILKAGGAYLPVDPHTPENRIAAVLEDCRAPMLLTTAAYVGQARQVSDRITAFSPTVVILDDSGQWVSGRGGAVPYRDLRSSDLVYVIFTSGTTGRPKGVLVEHRGGVNYTNWRLESYRYSRDDVTLQLLLYNFDGFVSNLYSGLLCGGKLILIPDFKKVDFVYISKTIITHHVTNMSLVPGMYEALLDTAAKGDLTSLRFVVLAGERAGANVIRKSKQENPDIWLINEYGPTESTVTAVVNLQGMEEANLGVIGRPIANAYVYILDNSLNIVPVKVPGELCIAGVGVARGYLNQPELTAVKFINSADAPLLPSPSFSLYRTGDLAYRLPNGDIRLLGRVDQQVKIRGYRIEPGEIESRLLNYPGIKAAIVLPVESIAAGRSEGDSREIQPVLCAYIVPGSSLELSKLKEYLSEDLPDYMIPTYFVQLINIPLTPNGKVDRKALPLPGLEAEEEYIAPRDETEKILAGIWSKVLSIETNYIGVNSNFFGIGGHSLKATQLIAEIHKTLDVEVPLVEIFQLQTIKKLAGYISKKTKDKYVSMEPVEKKDYYVLSSAQRRLYTVQQMNPILTSYNMPELIEIKGEPEKEERINTFKQLIERHESLRTSFELIRGDAVQRVHDSREIEFNIEYYELEEKNGLTAKAGGIREILNNFVRPFDLSRAPLLRVGSVKLGERDYLLLVDMHHIISDGVSHGILVKDYFALARGEKLPLLILQYKDYAEWQNSPTQRARLKKQEQYWLKVFEKGVPELHLPMDYSRPPTINYEGGSVEFEINETLFCKIKNLVIETESTLYIFLMAVFNVLLSKYTGQADIVVGAGVAGRTHADLQSVIGMFVNMLAMRNYPEEGKYFLDFLDEVKENALKAYEFQDYQFDELVLKLGIHREYGRNPIFDTQFTFQNIVEQAGEISDAGPVNQRGLYDFENRMTQFDLSLNGFETDTTLFLIIRYLTALFKRTTIEDMAVHFVEILEQITADKHLILKDIKVSSNLTTVKSNLEQADFIDF